MFKKSLSLSPRNVAMDYLSRREHSRFELHQKLTLKGFDEADITSVLNTLAAENLQNDSRFAQSYIHYRVSRGNGPIKIRHELKIKGVSFELIQQAEKIEDCDWYVQLEQVVLKKYGETRPIDQKDKQKWCRFLQQRGFAMQDIMRVFAH